MPYTVVLAVEQSDQVSETKALIEESGEFEVAAVVASAQDLLDALERHSAADAVVIRQELGPLPVLDLVSQIGLRHPYLAVVLVVREGTAEVLGAAMEAGVRALLTTPLSFEDVQTRLLVAARWSRTMRARLTGALTGPSTGLGGRVLALAGSKGGVGATTVAVYLALIAVAVPERRVCLVDLDLQRGDVPNFLAIEHGLSILDLADVAGDLASRTLEYALYNHPSGLRVLLAPEEGERGEDVTARAARQVLGALRSRFDVVVVDCGSSLTDAGAVAVELADDVLVVVTPDALSLRAGRRLVQMLGRLQVRKEEDLKVLINRVSRTSDVQAELARRIIAAPTLDTVLPAAFRSLQPVANSGDPRRLPDGGLRRRLAQLAAELGLVVAGQLGLPKHSQQRPRKRHRTRENGPGGGRRRVRGGGRGESGQSTAEFLGVLLVAAPVLLVVWELVWGLFGLVVVSNAANAGARVLATDQTTSVVRAAVRQHLPGPYQTGSATAVALQGDQGTVSVSVHIPVVPGVVQLPFTLRATAGTHVEAGNATPAR